MTIRTIKDAEAALQPYVPLVSQLTGKDTVLDRIWPLMERAGNPQERLKAIHIAGTSGKTSTAYYMAALLHATGKKVGLTVSPHVDSVAERVQINGQPLPEAIFCQELDMFLKIVDTLEQPPSYFELLYAFSLWVFDKYDVDYAVVETGMGGLHDATNIIRRPDKVCVITDIGFDHMHILGNSLSAIASQKIGIVHPGNVTFMYEQPTEAMDVFYDWATKHHAPLHILSEPEERAHYSAQNLQRLPAYQQRNWLLAASVCNYILNRDKLAQLTSKELEKTQRTIVPARMDSRTYGDKTIIMDGAHNAQKMQAFVESFKQLYPDQKVPVLIGLKQGKEYEEVVPLVASIASSVIVSAFHTSQDLPVESMSTKELSAAFKEAGVHKIEIIEDLGKAYAQLLKETASVGVVTGSFYLISQLRQLHLRKSIP